MLVVLLAAMPMMFAKPVNVETARKVGFQFINANVTTPLRSAAELQLVTTMECDNAEEVEIDIDNLGSGLYTVSVHTMNGTMINKIFVKE